MSWTPDVDDPLEYTINVLKDVMDADDLEGVLFYHPYRGKNGDDRGFWKRILFSESEWEDVRDDIKFSPHFHAIVVGSRVIGDEDTKQVEAETGWLIDRITKHANEKVSLYDDYDLARAVTYCLSHTGLYQTDGGNTKAAYRRFGKNTQEVTCSEDREARMDAIVRSVSPRTLGLEFSNLACTVEVDPDRDGAEEFRYEVDPHRGGVSQSPDGSTSFTDLPFQSQAELPNKPQGLQDDRDATDFSDDVGGVPDDPDSDGSIDHSVQDDVDDETTQVCHGRLLPLSKAPELLDDADWVDQAPHADDLREFYEEWKEKLDWLG